MNKTLFLLSAVIIMTACHTAKEKTNEAINKTGETIAQGTSEFVKGVKKGIDKAFDSEIDFSSNLKDKGIETGKVVTADSAGQENVLSVYIIFHKDFSQEILVKVLDKNGLEYGRIKQQVTGKKDEARFVDFYFGSRTSIEGKSKFIFE